MMNSTYENTVLDFDLNFLNQTSSNTETELQAKYEKLRKALYVMKRKVLFSHNAVLKYKSAKNYVNALENDQVYSKEGCKQHLIEIRNFVDKVARLENECRTAEHRDKEKDETISVLQNKIEALQSLVNQLNILVKEKNKTDVTAVKVDKKNNNKPGLKDCANIRKENTRHSILEKQIETLQRENAKIPNLEKTIENLRKENTKIKNLEQTIEELRKQNTGIPYSEGSNETLQKQLIKIQDLEKELENLHKENIKISRLEKELDNLRKENASIPRLQRENENLRNENARIPKLEKEIETLRIKNAKVTELEKFNKTLSEENSKITSKEKYIKTLHKQVASLKKEKDKLQQKYDEVLRKPKTLSDRNSDSGGISDDENDIFGDALLSPTPSTTDIAEKSPNTEKDPAPLECDSDYYSNEVVSVDTGRGSSLACSDNEKSPHSPEYFLNHSPLNEQNIEHEVETNVHDAKRRKSFKTATVPIIVNQGICESDNLSQTTIDQTNVCNKEDATASINILDKKTRNQNGKLAKDKECLELNNQLQCERLCDSEVQRIFSIMKLNYNAVSPIPKTPIELRDVQLSNQFKDLGEKVSRVVNLIGNHEQCLTQLKSELLYHVKELFSKSDGDLCSDNNVTTCFENIMKTHTLQLENSIVNPKADIQVSNEDAEVLQNSNVTELSHQSSIAIDVDMSLNVQDENILPQQSNSTLHDNILEEMPNHRVSETPRDSEMSKGGNTNAEYLHEDINTPSTKDSKAKNTKRKKITKLEKLKKNLEPKYKIRSETPPLVKSRVKHKHISPLEKKVENKITANDSSASLNDKHVYEKAVKVMAEINSQQNGKIAKSPPKNVSISSEHNTSLVQNTVASDASKEIPQNQSNTTQSKRKSLDHLVTDTCSVVLTKDPLVLAVLESKTSPAQKAKDDSETCGELTPRKRRRRSSNGSETQCKRILRSSTVNSRLSTEDNMEQADSNADSTRKSIEKPNDKDMDMSDSQPLSVLKNAITVECQQPKDHNNVITYDDLELFSEDTPLQKETSDVNQEKTSSTPCHPKDSILCSMIEKYGVETVRPFAKKIPDSTVKFICEKIEQEIAKILELPFNETKNAMNNFVADLRKLNYKHFIMGMIKYLTMPERKQELFGKVISPPAPAMTKAEQVLLYVISHLKAHWPFVDFVDAILSNIEYTIFKLNRTPDFDVIESTSHFYALLCRYFGAKSRLRLFILDAMYCIQFKSVPLIKQCLDVWMHIIPLAHMGIAKSPLVTCLVYLLHFYKCEDKFNRVQDIRNILSRKYFYEITDWNEKKILEMFKNSIMDLKDIAIERKMLRLALIILAKRHGPRWCQNNIIKNLLQPIIENVVVRNNVKEFCVSMIGPLMKPYPVDMKVHCEIAINQLTDIINNDPSPQMEEAATTSMMFINRHNQHRINQTLLSRRMKTMSPELEKILRDYVKAKPLKVWKKNLSKMAR